MKRHIANIAIGLMAALHGYTMVLEMFLWTHPLGLKAFNLQPEFAQATRALAANQGLYNGFLAIGLAWGLLRGQSGDPIKQFFLGCVLVAGLFGAATAATKILFIQAVPAAIAMALVWWARERQPG